jgi:anti-anti-sigma factor
MDFRFETTTRPGTYVLSLFGEFDLAAAEMLPDWAASLAGTPTVEVDLTGLTFMDSTGLRELLKLQQEVEAMDRKMLVKIVAGSNIDRLFDLTGLRDRFIFVRE